METLNMDANFEMRRVRDSMLVDSDWTQASDSPLSDDKKTEWATYRQALRNLPLNAKPKLDENVNLTGVTWPTRPVKSVKDKYPKP